MLMTTLKLFNEKSTNCHCCSFCLTLRKSQLHVDDKLRNLLSSVEFFCIEYKVARNGKDLTAAKNDLQWDLT